jgi:2'-5' RNA ligase
MAETIRSFVAIELPPIVRRQIGRLQEELQRRGVRGRWVKPCNIHLTLHFFGDVTAAQIEPIRSAMAGAAAQCQPLRLVARGLGVFPGIRKARVVWTGLDGDLEALSALHQRLAASFEKIGFPRERRRFKPHLTLGRFKKPPAAAALAEAIESAGGFSSPPFPASRVTLFESRLTPAGAVYGKIHEIPLEAGPAGPKPASLNGRTT